MKKVLTCAPCGRAGATRIECRTCERRGCKHFLTSVTDQDGNQYDPLRDPRPERLVGTCSACRVQHRKALS